ncbi:flagellar hook-length control protein FliK [Brevundimonas sp.]|uniref:flagellar hook-length control protein FliK n=1 Tax=Brevundimonas sp. TaxID=1871086 RepID=UPI002EDA0598
MSAQAVLSMMAPAVPANPRGSSGADASGFENLLATVLSGESAVPDVDGGGALPSAEAAPAESVDVSAAEDVAPTAQPVALPLLPQMEPKSGAADGAEPQVLPGAAAAKDTGPLVLPGVAVKGSEPQVLPDAAPGKGAEPQVLPGTSTAKGAGPQVLPGAAPSKEPGAQGLPDGQTTDATLPAARDGDQPETAPSAPAKSGATPVQPVLPPLRPLAERVSKPLDESAKPAEPGTVVETRTIGPATTPQPAPAAATQPIKSAATQPAPVADSGPAPADAAPAGDSASSPTEAAAPVRDHAASTLSRAAIDATAQIAAQILRKLEGRSTRFEIALRPDELGRVDVKLDIDSEGRLAARLAFDNPAAATDLRGRADELRRQLEAAGFQLAEDAFEFTERDSGSSAFDRGQDARHGQNRAFATAARLNAEIDLAQPPQWLARSLSPSGVDMKV